MLSKAEFVSLCIEYQNKKKQAKREKQKKNYDDVMGHIIENHYKIERRCRWLKNV